MHILRDKIEGIKLNKNQIVIDIESTGVHKDHSYIQAIGILVGGSESNFIQVFIDNKDEEIDLLKAISPYIYKDEYISFNGKNFDIPFINYKLITYGLDILDPKSHLDLYQYIRSNKAYMNLNNYGLQDLEKYLSIERDELVFSNYEQSYYSIVEDEKIKKILLHNKYDVLNTYHSLKIVDIIEAQKTFSIKNKFLDAPANIYLMVKDISINKESLKVRLSSDTLLNLRYDLNRVVLKWDDYDIEIFMKVDEGYISEKNLGIVFNSSEYSDIYDLSKYNLPRPYMLIYSDLHIELENLKKIITSILSNL